MEKRGWNEVTENASIHPDFLKSMDFVLLNN